MRTRQNGCHFADDVFKCIFLNEDIWISLKISLKFVPKARINQIPTLVSLGDWKNISITHLIIIIKSEVSTFPIVVIFFRGCVSEMVVLSYSVIYYIYIPGTLGPCFHYWCSVYGICKWSDTLWPVGRVRLFADYTISLSSLCRLIWKHWTTKMLVRYMMPSVCLRLRQFSQLSLYSLYGAVCLRLTQFCDDRENVYFILLSSSNRKYESLTIV